MCYRGFDSEKNFNCFSKEFWTEKINQRDNQYSW